MTRSPGAGAPGRLRRGRCPREALGARYAVDAAMRAANNQLIAANAQIGVAKAAFYPSISLTGLFGYASTDLSDLFKGPSRTWQFAGALS